MNNFFEKKILLIICGGISAYKSLELIRLFKKKGASVKTILTKSAKEISVAEVIEAMEGPISLTECASDNCGCSYESYCAVGKPWQKIN